MAGSPERILATHVGSLVRPPQLVEFLKIIEAGQPYDKTAYEACLRAAIEEVVRQQVEAGIDIVSDGEFSKGRNWAFYVHDRISGISTRQATPEEMKDPLSSAGGGQDHKPFPSSTPNTTGPRAWARVLASASSSTAPSPTTTRPSSATSPRSRRRPPRPTPPAPSCRWWRRRAPCPAPRTSIMPTRKACCLRSPTACTRNTRRSSTRPLCAD